MEKSQSHVQLIVFAYGALDVFESVLLKRGVRPGAPPSIPDSHVHHYHVERDAEERAVLQELDWRVNRFANRMCRSVDCLEARHIADLIATAFLLPLFDVGVVIPVRDAGGAPAPRWDLRINAGGLPSLNPSVWRQTGCRSHFWLRDGHLEWCE